MIAARLWLPAACLATTVGCSPDVHCVEIRPEYAGAVPLPTAYAYYATRTDGPGRFGGEELLPRAPDLICTYSEGKDEHWTLQAWIFKDIGCPPDIPRCAPNPGDPQGAVDFVFKNIGTTVVHVTIADPSP